MYAYVHLFLTGEQKTGENLMTENQGINHPFEGLKYLRSI